MANPRWRIFKSKTGRWAMKQSDRVNPRLCNTWEEAVKCLSDALTRHAVGVLLHKLTTTRTAQHIRACLISRKDLTLKRQAIYRIANYHGLAVSAAVHEHDDPRMTTIIVWLATRGGEQ
jgi:hypothetical protein